MSTSSSSTDDESPKMAVIESSIDKDEPPVKCKIDEAITSKSPVFEPLIVDGNDALLVSVSSPGRVFIINVIFIVDCK